VKAFVVNLDRRPDRLAKITRALDSIDLEFQRVSAVDGRELHLKEHIRPWMAWLYEGFSYPLTGAIGCYLSHLKIWQYIINEDIDQAMVLEDDVLPHKWDKDILRINLGSLGIDLLRIGVGEQRYQRMKDMIATNVSRSETIMVCSRHIVSSTIKGAPRAVSGAYIITNKGAAICSRMGKYWFPVDNYHLWECVYGLRSAIILPPMFIASKQDTDIGPKKRTRIGQESQKIIISLIKLYAKKLEVCHHLQGR